MTILKSYDVTIFFLEGDDCIDEVIKARSAKHAEALVMANNVGVDWVMVDRSKTKLQYERQFNDRRPKFYKSVRRGGQYLYRHKGKKLRNRRNYPTPSGGWYPAGKLTFSYTETYSIAFNDVLSSWLTFLTTPTERVLDNTVITITGPTCSGKTHLVRFLQTLGIHEVRSFTSRQPRLNEITEGPGRAYDFVTHAEAEALRSRTEDLIECVEFHGNIYGNTIEQRDEALAATEAHTGVRLACVVVEPNGVDHWREAAKARGDFEVMAVYLEQPVEVLIARFQERLDAAKDDATLAYETGRRERMITVEHPTWRELKQYDLLVKNLGLSDVPGAPTLQHFYEYLKALYELK